MLKLTSDISTEKYGNHELVLFEDLPLAVLLIDTVLSCIILSRATQVNDSGSVPDCLDGGQYWPGTRWERVTAATSSQTTTTVSRTNRPGRLRRSLTLTSGTATRRNVGKTLKLAREKIKTTRSKSLKSFVDLNC